MFRDTATTNPYTGCEHGCPWCYAKELILHGRISSTPKYRSCGFAPTFHPEVLERRPPRAEQLFLCSLGDLFGEWVELGDISRILNWVKSTRSERILLLTKNPARYLEIIESGFDLDPRFCFGATIESTMDKTDRHGKFLGPEAPNPFARMFAMERLRFKYPELRRFVSIEPLLLLDRVVMREWIKRIGPEFVYIGYDNHSFVPWYVEPRPEQVRELIEDLRGIIEVRLKTIKKSRVTT